MSWKVGEQPTVRIRPPIATLIWPSMFLSAVSIFISFVLIRGLLAETDLQPLDAAGYLVVGSLFIGLPIIMLIGVVRGGASSDGPVLKLRCGLTMRSIPAEDIEGFVGVDSIGRRSSRWPHRQAVALRRGSPSDRADQWDDRAPVARALRQLGFRLSNRQAGDFPISGTLTMIGARRQADIAIEQLTRWHDWALEHQAT